MKFGWINLFGAIIVFLMMIPNVFYAFRYRDEKNLCENKIMNLIEQIGRYACIVLMWLPLFVWKFSFLNSLEFLIYIIGNIVLLLVYTFEFILFFKEKNALRAMVLAVLPACIFLLSGLILRHWLLVCFSILFAVSHIYVSKKNNDAV